MLTQSLTLFPHPTHTAVTKQQAETENTSSQPITTSISIISPTQACPPLTQTSSPYIVTSPTTQPSSCNSSKWVLQTPQPQMVVVRDYQILIIVIPAAVVTVLLVICVVAIGVCICMRHNDNNGWR